jgi:hypothetical protein
MGTTTLGRPEPQHDPHAEKLEAIAARTAERFPSLSAKLRQIARDSRGAATACPAATRSLGAAGAR